MQPAILDLPFSEIKLSYHPKIKASDRLEVRNSDAAASILRKCWDNNLLELQEQFKIILLDNVSHVMGVAHLCSGGFNGIHADRKLVFSTALRARCHNVLLAHNHPSGRAVASESDIELTRSMIEGGKVLDVCVVDHIILTRDSYCSMVDDQLI